MKQNEYFEEMETIEFQVQFSVLSGFQSLLRAYSRDPTVMRLIADLLDDQGQTHKICERITYLINVADPRYFDESIAAYLFCLSKVDLPMAHEASERILKTGGLWWSVQLALYVIKTTETEAA
ncbi:MAG: hypothetical protein OXN88_13910 [Chloroflexota bacterium]|nr:hypothetical protein [Chloroflexota bacterium]